MKKASAIEDEFRDRALFRGGLSFYRAADAIKLIQRSRQLGMKVLGVDVFIDHHTAVQPMVEHSTDFSNERNTERLEDSWQQAESFVRAREAEPFLFEVVIEQSDDAVRRDGDAGE